MRVYLPATIAELASAGGLSARVAHAVTAALRTARPDEDEEGLEFAAQLLAADDSLDRLTPGDPRRRVVVAADVPDPVVESADDADLPPSAVRVTVTVHWADVACAHVDEAAAEADVAAAVGGDDAAVERLAERDLLWFDVSELGRLVEQVRGR